jgi:predicted Zn-dependent protease
MSLRAIASDPTNPSYLDTVGWVYFKLGNYEEAREYVAKALAAGEASAAVVEHMGDIMFRLGKQAEAEKYWNDALKMNVNNETLKQKIARGKL